MEFDFENIPKELRYKLLCAYVSPRPIALITTISSEGVGNTAPMSFFNVFGDDPPLLIVGIRGRDDGQDKDTTRNMKETGEFVIHMVDHSMADGMITCSVEFPPGEDELQHTNFTTVPCAKVKPPRILEAPAAFECRLVKTIEYEGRSIVMGEVVYSWIKDECIDEGSLYVNSDSYRPLARLHGDFYLSCEKENLFEIYKPSYEEWMEKKKANLV